MLLKTEVFDTQKMAHPERYAASQAVGEPVNRKSRPLDSPPCVLIAAKETGIPDKRRKKPR
jgi:hypothetical protein